MFKFGFWSVKFQDKDMKALESLMGKGEWCILDRNQRKQSSSKG
jgi:hypothetical protein